MCGSDYGFRDDHWPLQTTSLETNAA